MDVKRECITGKGRRLQSHLRAPSLMSPDASALLDRLTLIETSKVRGSGSVMEWLKRGYSRVAD
jgi:hypothetical protein